MRPVVLLTGSTGYIGQHLLRYCAEHTDWEIVKADRSEGFDLSLPGWTDGLPERGVDIVIHLAQSRRYRDFPTSAQDIFRVNVASTAELLEWARKNGVKRFLFASTGNVYAPRSGKLTEMAECASGSMYAATKLSAEFLIQAYSSFFETVISRLFCVYGPGQGEMLIAEMIDRVRHGRTITLALGVGLYVTPMFIRDCVKSLTRLAVAPMPGRVNIVNVAGDELLSLRDIVDAIALRVGRPPVVQITNEPALSLCGDNSRLRIYCPDRSVTFSGGLALTLEAMPAPTSSGRHVP